MENPLITGNIHPTGLPSRDRPWLRYYPQEVIEGSLPDKTVYRYMEENNRDHPDDVALIYYGRNITYGRLLRNIEKTAKALFASGVREGDIVTVALPTIPEALYLVYGLNRLGAVANMIHPLAGGNEIVNYLNEVKSTHFFMFYGTYEKVRNSLGKTNVSTGVVISASESLPFPAKFLYRLKRKEKRNFEDKTLSCWSDFIKLGGVTVLPRAKKDPETPAVISHTGGTTGDPKGVVVSDLNINAEIWQIGCNYFHRRGDTMMPTLPPFINYSLVNAMLEPLAFGYKVPLIPDFDPKKFDIYIKKYRPNDVYSIPAYWETLLSNEKIREADLSCLRYSCYGGEGMNEKVEESVNRLLLSRGAGLKLLKGLGSTEMTSAATATYRECNPLGSVGIPLVKVNCKIVVPGSEDELPCGEEGEICFSGPQLMMGYYKNQRATDEIIKVHRDGCRWIHTGDLGYLDDNGILFVSGRIKRIVMTRGSDGIVTKIFPERIENIVLTHPAVSACCAIGVADSDRINYPRVYIVTAPGYERSDALTGDIVSLCRENLPEYSVPCEIVYRDDLPRTERGKVDYRALEREEASR